MVGYLACSFDLLNVGDLDVIDQARERCDELVVGVHDDGLVEAATGRPPVVPLSERLSLVSHLRGVSRVVVHRAGRADEQGPHVSFVLAGDPEADAPAALVLTPRRETVSPILRAALRAAPVEAVA